MIPLSTTARLVDACYAQVMDERAWARELVGALAPVDGVLGAHAWRRDGRSGGAAELLASTAEAPAGFGERSPGSVVWEALLCGRGIELLSRRAVVAPRAAASELRRFVQSLGAADVILVRGDDGGSIAVVLVVAIARGPASAPATLRALRPFAKHLSAALRLRRCLADARTRSNASEGGRRGALAEWAQGEARRAGTPLGAIAVWAELLAGRYSVVDWRADAGSCALLLRPAAPHDPRALTGREGAVVSRAALGHSNKEIAYALGIGETTVATHLGVASVKLHVPSRRALIALFGPSCAPPTTPSLARAAGEGAVTVH